MVQRGLRGRCKGPSLVGARGLARLVQGAALVGAREPSRSAGTQRMYSVGGAAPRRYAAWSLGR